MVSAALGICTYYVIALQQKAILVEVMKLLVIVPFQSLCGLLLFDKVLLNLITTQVIML